jgi:hypothetical protein
MPDPDKPGRSQTGCAAAAPEARSFKPTPRYATDNARSDEDGLSARHNDPSEITRPSRFRADLAGRP